MATTLVSPGISTSLTDDTGYASGTGTTPLIIFATHENKTTPSGSTATKTLSTNAGTLTYCTSQRDVINYFGEPVFYTSGGTALDGYELNEYGLHALYETSALSACYALRASIDLGALVSTSTEPRGEAADGTYWLNPVKTQWGVYLSNGSVDIGDSWSLQTVTGITDASNLELSIISLTGQSDTTTSVITTGNAGNLVINNVTLILTAGTGSLGSIVGAINEKTTELGGVVASTVYVDGKYYLKLTQPDITKTITIDYDGTPGSSTEATLVALGLMESGSTTAVSGIVRPISTFGSNGDFAVNSYYSSNIVYQKVISIVAGDSKSSLATGLWYIVGSTEWITATQNSNQLYVTYSQKIPTTAKSGDVWINLSSAGAGLSYYLQEFDATSGVWNSISVDTYTSMNNLNQSFTSPKVGDVAAISPYVAINSDGTVVQSTIMASSNLLTYNGTSWVALNYTASASEPTTSPESGTLWFNGTNFVVDIMINQNGNTWVGYQNYTGYKDTDPNGPILAATKPTTQSDGTALVTGDIWIDTSDTENYPKIYRYSGQKKTFILTNNANSITPSGIVFADARASNGSGLTTQASLLVSNFVDPDAPNPELYPDGVLLFNTRIATNNVKEWHPNYFTSEYGAITENGITTVTDYTSVGYTNGITSFSHLTGDGGRWVTVSGNFSDGSPRMGRKAQRYLIVTALQSVVTSNEDIRSDIFYYSLIATPGYPELIDEMNSLNNDIHNEAFIIGDTPSRLQPTSSAITSLLSGTSVNPEFNISTASAFVGVYYPWGKGTNVDGTNIVIPPSTMMLRTIINSDNLSQPWYPPAGFTRGVIDNATSVGYIDATTGDYTAINLSQGQRDILYTNNINPIAFMVGKGIVAYGQKTRYGQTTALDRINTARLICYLNYQFRVLAKPFLFELNVSSTRTNAKSVFDRFMANMMTLNAVTDYLVVCDTTNNTSATIDAHELWIDVIIVGTSAIEFIFIPIRLENTGTDLSSVTV